jgi:uncharacterized protein (TIGR01244 family)
VARSASAAALLCVALGCSGLPDEPVPTPAMPSAGAPVPLADDPARLFDFWLGEWNVQNKHLDGRAWADSGTAVARIQPVAGGTAVLEQWNGTLGGDPLIGFSLRAWDPGLAKWVIHLNWHGGKPGGFSEMHGVRNGERIEQFPPGDDTRLRYSFSLAHEDSCQWDEAKSKDGEVWITDWLMQFTRRDRPWAVDASNAPVVEPPAEAAAFEQTRALDFLIGAWQGSARVLETDGSWRQDTVHARVSSMIAGFGLLQFLDRDDGERTFAALGWDSRAEGWVALRADDGSDGILRMQGEPGERRVTFTGGADTGLRESWVCAGLDACTWRRERAADEGAWETVVEADLRRETDVAAWIDIPKARAPHPGLLTGGQVTFEHLEQAAREGYRTVINLRPLDEPEQPAGEAERVRELGMEYVHIPVAGGEDVRPENARLLADALARDGALPAIVHCKSGNRVGALLALGAHHVDGATPEEALALGLDAGLTRLEPTVRERLGLPAAAE